MKLLTILLCIIYLIIVSTATGQSGFQTHAGARSAALGNHFTTFTDINAVYHNQAGLARLRNSAFHVSARRRYNVSELFGFKGYNEQQIGIGYALALSPMFSISAQFDLLAYRIDGYGNSFRPTFEVGIQTLLTNDLTLGFHIFNPAGIKMAESIYLPIIIRIGLGYQISGEVSIFAEIEKDVEFIQNWKSGLEYKLNENFTVRLGTSGPPTNLHGGCGFRITGNMQIDIAGSYHQVLGLTPAFSITYNNLNNNGSANRRTDAKRN
jgi:hypothetical protein